MKEDGEAEGEEKEEEEEAKENGKDQPEEEEDKREEVVESPCRVKKISATEERNDRLNAQNAVVQPLLTGIISHILRIFFVHTRTFLYI